MICMYIIMYIIVYLSIYLHYLYYLTLSIYLSIYISILSIYLSCICLASKYLVYWLYPLYTDNLLIQPVLDAIHSPPILPSPLVLFTPPPSFSLDFLHSRARIISILYALIHFFLLQLSRGGGRVPKPPSSKYAPYFPYFINHFLFQFPPKPILERSSLFGNNFYIFVDYCAL